MNQEETLSNFISGMRASSDVSDWISSYRKAKKVPEDQPAEFVALIAAELFVAKDMFSATEYISKAETFEKAIEFLRRDSNIHETFIDVERTVNDLESIADTYKNSAWLINLLPRKNNTIYYTIGLVFSLGCQNIEPLPCPTLRQAAKFAQLVESEAHKAGIAIDSPSEDRTLITRQMRTGMARGLSLAPKTEQQMTIAD